MIDVVEVGADLKSGKLATEMHEQFGKKYLILKDTESGEGVCVWREERGRYMSPKELREWYKERGEE